MLYKVVSNKWTWIAFMYLCTEMTGGSWIVGVLSFIGWPIIAVVLLAFFGDNETVQEKINKLDPQSKEYLSRYMPKN